MTLALGCIVAAGMIKFGPWAAKLQAIGFKGPINVLCVALLLVSAYSFGFIDGADRDGDKLREANKRIDFLKVQNEINKQVADQARELAQTRQIKIAQLQVETDGYLEEIQNKTATACPADPNYSARLQRIIKQQRHRAANAAN